MSYLLRGLLIGAAIGIAAVAIVGTGGLAAAAIVGGMAVAGAGIGEVMSTMSWAPKSVSGAIVGPCSLNVFTNTRPAARAHIDFVMCALHPNPPPPIATGSATVFINSQPAARVGDKTGCGGDITDGSSNVYIGGGTIPTDIVQPEDLVPGWVHAAMFAVGIGSAVILAGPIVAVCGLVGGMLGGVAGSWIGGKIWGDGSDGQKWSMLGGSFLGGFLGMKGGGALAEKVVASTGATESVAAADAAAETPKNYGVAFFGADNYTKYYSGTNVLIGAPGGKPFFFMPLEDSGLVTNAGDAARYTGMAPSAQKAYMTNGDIYGISFPTDGMPIRLPTAADAGGWPHYLEGGNTAVKLEGPNAGYLLNPTREFVLPGGSPAPAGSVIFKLGPDGEWIPLRRF